MGILSILEIFTLWSFFATILFPHPPLLPFLNKTVYVCTEFLQYGLYTVLLDSLYSHAVQFVHSQSYSMVCTQSSWTVCTVTQYSLYTVSHTVWFVHSLAGQFVQSVKQHSLHTVILNSLCISQSLQFVPCSKHFV